MGDGIEPKRTFRPHERTRVDDGSSPAIGDAHTKKRDADAPAGKDLVGDVFQATHQIDDDAEQAKFRAKDATTERARADHVEAKDRLTVGGATYKLDAAAKRSMTALEPNRQVIAAVDGAIRAGRPLLLSAAPGSGAAYTAAWALRAMDRPHEIARLSKNTPLEALVGALRPEDGNALRVKDGPLTRAIRDGRVMVIDSVERADPQVRAALKALAAGLKRFHHPVSGELIDVHPEFRLVMIGDQRERRLGSQLGVRTVREIRAYDEAEHRRLLVDQVGLPEELAGRLAQFHENVMEAVDASDLDFSRGFPLGWSMLERVGRRLASARDPDDAEIGRALMGVYGARLTKSHHRDAFRGLLEDLDAWPPKQRPARNSADESFVRTPRIDRILAQAEDAMVAGEMLHLRGAGQSGMTTLVEEIAQRRGQELVTIVGHSGLDAQTLVERPTFDEAGDLYFKPGRITRALLEGGILFVDHLDQLPREQQNAIFALRDMKTIRVLEGDTIVDKKVDPRARIVMSTTTGHVRGRATPEASDRAMATEIAVDAPDLDEVTGPFIDRLVPGRERLQERLSDVIYDLDAEGSIPRLNRLQRMTDFVRTAELLSESGFTNKGAIARALRMVFDPKESDVLTELDSAKPMDDDVEGPLWQRVLGLSDKDVASSLDKTGYRITNSMHAHLDALAIAHRLGRPVRSIGPASSGKTVLGSVFGALIDKSVVRTNFSQSTEGQSLLSAMAPVSEGERTIFKESLGPARTAAQTKSLLMADEWNLSRQGQMALKSALDKRGRLIDPEADIEESFAESFFYAAQNENDPALGRYEPPPEVADCMFTIFVDPRPVDEKIEVVKSQCDLKGEHVEPIANVFADLEVLVERGKLSSQVAPITATERDILKAARMAHYLIERDRVRGPDEQRQLVGREVFRVIRDQLASPEEREMVLDLVRKRFGDDIEPPPRPNGVEKVTVEVDGESVEMVQIGSARFPVRVLPEELQKDVPKLDGIRDPVGIQFEFLESVLLGAELKEPVAVVGNTGTGKTMLMKWLAHHLNQPVIEQPFNADMTEEHLFGAQVIGRGGKITFKYGDIPTAIKNGYWYIGDEPTTLGHSVREALNPVTERSEIQIAQKRPPETIPAKDWDPQFRYFETANGDDIRQDGYSAPEASRRRMVVLPELDTIEDYEAVARRDYLSEGFEPIEGLKRTDENRAAVRDAILEFIEPSAFNKALVYAFEGEEVEAVEDVPSLELTDAQAKTIVEALSIYTYKKKDASVRELLTDLLAASTGEAALRVAPSIDPEVLSPRAKEALAGAAVVEGRLVDPDEVMAATELFFSLRELQRDAPDASLTPLTPRIYGTFMDALVQLRTRRSFGAALMRASEMFLAPKLPASVRKDLTAHVEDRAHVGDETPASVPEQLATKVRFGEVYVERGSERPWKPSNERFPLTEPRCRNLQAIGEAVELGRGRPISITDDENGEAVETLREFGRITGRRVTEVTLPPNVELEQLLERLVVSATSKSGFEPELQQIAQAIKDGHTLVLRGCGQVSTNRLERLNSLGDGRNAVHCPVSGEWLEAHPQFRLVMMRTPDSVEKYSAALENRLVTPPLTTQHVPTTEAARESRAAELAAVLRERCEMSRDTADKLGVFHVYLNHMLREGRFASGRAVGTFLNHDAESVGRRLAWLVERNEVDDEDEALVELVMSIYGERLATPTDRDKLLALVQKAFSTESTGVDIDATVSPGPNMNRVGPWALTRDPRGRADDLPKAEAVLPEGEVFDQVLQKVSAAAQFDEVIHLTGNDFIADAAVASLARLTTSPVVEVEGNRDMTEAHLFGGTVQDQQTGDFVETEGLIFQAQREGGTVVVKNASTLPPEVLTRLTQIAATGHLQRVKNGVLEEPARTFSLVLRTSEGDPPLARELMSLARTVRCPEIEDGSELVATAAHHLRAVAGGAQIAEELVSFHLMAVKALETESLVGRQQMRIDSARLVEATRDLAELVANGEPLERAVTDVVTRLYLHPLDGMDLSETLEDAFSRLVEALDGWLEIQRVPPIDLVANPEVDALRQDYERVSNDLAGELFASAGDALGVALDKRDAAQVRDVLAALESSSMLPPALAKRAAKLAKSLTGDRLEETAARSITTFSKKLTKSYSAEGDFKEAAHGFLRGARVWDLEYRLQIVGRYHDLFGTLAKAGSGIAQTRLEELERLAERFDGAQAQTRLEASRRAVDAATVRYEQRGGANDPQIDAIFKRLVSTWDLVSTSPIFRAHALPELKDLEKHLVALEAAYDARGTPTPEFVQLSEAMREASRALEGMRIAEQSADLRRGLARSNQSTEQIVRSLRSEVETIRTLDSAKSRNEVLTQVERRIATATGDGGFLRLDPSGAQVTRPEGRSDTEIGVEAAQLAEAEVRLHIAEQTERIMGEVQNLASAPAASPATVFANYDLEMAPDAPTVKATPAELHYETQMAALTKSAAAMRTTRTKAHAEALRAKDDERIERMFDARLKQSVQEVGAQIQGSATELIQTINSVSGALEVDPDLAADVDAAVQLLQAARDSAGGWMRRSAEAAYAVGRGILRVGVKIMTFGFGDLPPEQVEPAPELAEAKRAAQRVLERLHAIAVAERQELPDFNELETHEANTDVLTQQLVSAQTLGELAAKFSKIDTLRQGEDDAGVARHLAAVAGSITRERGMEETLRQVSAFVAGADALSAAAAEGGVPVEMARAVDAVMSAAESVRTQSLAAGAYKNTVRSLARAVERIDEMAEEGSVPEILVNVREEIVALEERIQAMFVGRQDLLTIEAGNYREMLRSLGEATGEESSAHVVEAAVSRNLARFDAEATVAEADVERLTECIGGIGERRDSEASANRPSRAARLATINVSFDRASEIAFPEIPAEDDESAEEAAAKSEAHTLRGEIYDVTKRLEDGVAERSGGLEGEAAAALEALDALEASRGVRAMNDALGRLDEVRAAIDAIATEEQDSRTTVREVGLALKALRKLSSTLRGLEAAPEEAIAKIDAVVEGARPLASAFRGERFGFLARDWAAQARAALTNTRGTIVDTIEALPEEKKSGNVVVALESVVDRLTQPIGRLGAWSRSQLLWHAKQRIEATLGHDDAEDPKLAALLEKIDAGVATHAAVADGPEYEEAAADVLGATLDIGAAMIAAKKPNREQLATYETLVGQVDRILAAEVPENDRENITDAIQTVQALTKGKGPVAEAARELSVALGHVRQAENHRTIVAEKQALRTSAESYLETVRDARVLLDEAAKAFLDYDPLESEQPLKVTARALRDAVTTASEAMNGPAAVVIARAFLDLQVRLQGLGDGPISAEAGQIVEELDPVVRNARAMAEAKDAPELFTKMVAHFDDKTSAKKKRTDELAKWAQGASEALRALMAVEDAEMPALLASTLDEWFEALKPKTPSAPATPTVQAETKPVKPVKSALAGLVDTDRRSVGAALGALAAESRSAPNAPDGERTEGVARDVENRDAPRAEKGSDLGEIQREELSGGEVTERSDKIEIVSMDRDGLDSIRDRMQSAAIDEVHENDGEVLLSEFETFIEENAELVDKMASTLREYPGLETVIVVDQSGSTSKHSNGTSIIDQERAAAALVMAAHMRAERNCAVVGFGNGISSEKPTSSVGGGYWEVDVFVHKPMALKLDAEAANFAYGVTGNCGGGTDFIEPINVGMGQFTSKANNKLVLLLTDAQLHETADVRRKIDTVRDGGVGVAVLGFGAARHVSQLAGEFGEHVSSYEQAIERAHDLFLRAVVDNAGRFQGDVDGAADGIGTPQGQHPMEAAPSDGPMDTALDLAHPVDIAGDPGEVYAARGPRRELINTVDRGVYERALKALDLKHRSVTKTPSFKRCRQEVAALRRRHEREGTIEALAGAIQPGLPKTRGVEWERKQLSGPSFDERQLVIWAAGRAQGVPVQRIFKRRKGADEAKATVVLAMDESSSMGDSEKMRANLEAMIAYGDALKAIDPEIKIAVVGYGDRVRLHAGFEHAWDDELKAHLLHQIRGEYDATDDERGAAESIGLLKMMEAEVGMVMNFSDGQGMPGAEDVMRSAKDDGFSFLTVGVGPDCVGVSRLGPYGLYARNLAQMIQKMAPSMAKSWELAGRLA
ncbi:MAG: AAA family ATPase [Deltaproteobacteria bacterium]